MYNFDYWMWLFWRHVIFNLSVILLIYMFGKKWVKPHKCKLRPIIRRPMTKDSKIKQGVPQSGVWQSTSTSTWASYQQKLLHFSMKLYADKKTLTICKLIKKILSRNLEPAIVWSGNQTNLSVKRIRLTFKFVNFERRSKEVLIKTGEKGKNRFMLRKR